MQLNQRVDSYPLFNSKFIAATSTFPPMSPIVPNVCGILIRENKGMAPTNEVNMRTHNPSVNIRFVSRRFIAMLLLQLLPASAALAADIPGYGGDCNEHWVASWSTTLHQPGLSPGLANTGFNNQTLRQIVHTSIGGRKVRVRLSTFGAGGLVVGAAHIALSAGGPSVVSGSDRALTFGGEPSITIPPGALVISDPVELAVPAVGDLAVTVFVPGVTGPATWHFDALQTSYISPSGDFTANTVMPLNNVTPTTTSWFWIAGVDIMASRQPGAIAALGDSITNGVGSTADANQRWLDDLARRLTAERDHLGMGVVNEGLDGNRLLNDGLGPNGLERFERDVLSQPGLTHIIVSLGLNDIGTGWPGGLNPDQQVSVDQIIQGDRQLIVRAHTRGARIYGATITPFNGAFVPGTSFALYSPGNETKRQEVNSWIRTSNEFDGVIDFDGIRQTNPMAADRAKQLNKFESYLFLAQAEGVSLETN
jgi:lysophospholipase L1-like esterase